MDCYTSTNELLIEYLEKEKCSIKQSTCFNRCSAALACRCYRTGEKVFRSVVIFQNAGSYILTSQNCPPQTHHKELEHTRERNPGSWYVLAWEEPTSLGVRPGNQKFVHYLEKYKKKLAIVLKILEADNPANCSWEKIT